MNVVLHGKKDFARVTKLKPCEQEIILDYPGRH